MIALDASVAVKWFKPGERYDAEAQQVLARIRARMVTAFANEWLGLEVVRGLKRAQRAVPPLAIGDPDIQAAYDALGALFRSGAITEVTVAAVKDRTCALEIALGLYAADAVHLATAIHAGARWLVSDDDHLLGNTVRAYAATAGVTVVSLPELIVQLPVTS